MRCPDCKGTGENAKLIPVFLSTRAKTSKLIKLLAFCDRCQGNKKVPNEMAKWIKIGNQMKAKRIRQKITLRKAAQQLKMKSSELSEMERGYIKPDPKIYKVF